MNKDEFEFGADKVALSQRLRELADKIDTGKLVVRRIETRSNALSDDYKINMLAFDFYEA